MRRRASERRERQDMFCDRVYFVHNVRVGNRAQGSDASAELSSSFFPISSLTPNFPLLSRIIAVLGDTTKSLTTITFAYPMLLPTWKGWGGRVRKADNPDDPYVSFYPWIDDWHKVVQAGRGLRLVRHSSFGSAVGELRRSRG